MKPIATLAAAVLCAGLLTACSEQAQKSAQDAASAAPGTAKDALIAGSIKTKISAIDLDAATSVNVAVSNGRVTLTGEVRNEGERGQFENAARSVEGVTGVSDTTRINPGMHGPKESLGDAGLAAKVAASLAGQTGLNAFHIKTQAHDGIVTLSGALPTQAIKDTALETARHTDGVRSVVDRLTVNP